MSHLWHDKEKLLTIDKKPSPNFFSTCPARGESPYLLHKKQNSYVMDGTSLSIFPESYTKAGMTVEAAIVLPLFLFFFLNLGCALEMIRLHGNLELALWNVGNQLAVYGAALEERKESEISDIIFSYSYIKASIVNYLGEEYLEESPLYGGVNGLQFVESELFTEDDNFEIVTTYAVTPYSEWGGFRPFCMVNRYYGHLWNGYAIVDAEREKDIEIVYITENGEVYHERADCSHLKLTILPVTLQAAYQMRNVYGEKYRQCIMCGTSIENPEVVWITTDGIGIHCRRECSGLKRTIRAMDKSKLKGIPPCIRCAN